jgi:hypothetical protein
MKRIGIESIWVAVRSSLVYTTSCEEKFPAYKFAPELQLFCFNRTESMKLEQFQAIDGCDLINSSATENLQIAVSSHKLPKPSSSSKNPTVSKEKIGGMTTPAYHLLQYHNTKIRYTI